MNDQVKALLDEARKLTAPEREELAELLLETLERDPAMERAWSQEAQRRWEAHVASGAEAVDALGAVDDARRELKRRGKA